VNWELPAVTIVLRHNETLELNLVEYRDSILLSELKALAGYVAARPEHMRRDNIGIVMPGGVFSGVEMTALDSLFALYRDLYSTLEFQMLRRAAWVCQSPAAQAHVDHWLSGDTKGAMSSAVRRFDTISEACEWLVLSTAEAPGIERREGFAEVMRFGPALAR
jgi:hypothetical protein